MADSLLIEAPSRLHFGMFAFGEGHARQFGGVGLMVEQPRLVVTIRPAARFICGGLHAERVARVARQVAEQWLGGRLPECEVTIESAPREHSGLGLGTQLSLAVGTGLTRFSELRAPPSPLELAVGLGRAQRSSVGAHGFAHGGLIVEAGHAVGEAIGPLVDRVELPPNWRVVLVTPRVADGLSGSREWEAFAQLPSVSPETAGQLAAEVLLAMLPAAKSIDFDAFAGSVHRYGHAAGMCFASVQGGAYTSRAAPIVQRLRELGMSGVGQSSWGPTVFALARDDESARALCAAWAIDPLTAGSEISVSRPDNRGAVVE